MLKRNDGLINGRGLGMPGSAIDCGAAQIAEDNAAFIAALVAQGVQNPSLPPNPPFETHPYRDLLPLQNYEKYIIGTFPPISYVLDNPTVLAAGIHSLSQPLGAGGRQIEAPKIPFYHGNVGSMWDFLLTQEERNELCEQPRNAKREWLIAYLTGTHINYADIIDSTQRNLNQENRYNGGDENLNNICPNTSLIFQLLSNKNVNLVLFNTSSIFGNAGIILSEGALIDVTKKTKAFDLFVRTCQELGLGIQIRIPFGAPLITFPWTDIQALQLQQRKTKVVFEMRVYNPTTNVKIECGLNPGEERSFTVITPFSPAAVNRGRTRDNEVVSSWLLANPDQTPRNLLSLLYQSFRLNDFHGLYDLNV